METPEKVLEKFDLNFNWMTSKSYKNRIVMAMEDYARQYYESKDGFESKDGKECDHNWYQSSIFTGYCIKCGKDANSI